MEIYIGNLPAKMTEGDIRTLFRPYGSVKKVRMIYSNKTGDFKGYAFVSMPIDKEAKNAIEQLKETKMGKIKIKISPAKSGAMGRQKVRLENRSRSIYR